MNGVAVDMNTPSISMIGLSGAVGSSRVTLEELSLRFGIPAHKIRDKTGITGLCRLRDDESLVDMARDASLRVLDHCGISKAEVSGVFGSSNPTTEHLLPTFTAAVARALGLSEVIADHVGIGCCGGLQALRNACNQLVVDRLVGRTSRYLVIAGDQTSRILDPEKKQTGTLFGEGVSALLLTNVPDVEDGYEIVSIGTKSLLGAELEALRIRNPYSPRSREGAPPSLEMDGHRVSAFAERAVEHFLAILGLPAFPEGCHLVPHQPNLRLLEAMIERSGLDPGRVYLEGIRTIGNTSAPAAFLGLEDGLRRGLIDPRSGVLLGSFGAELQVGAALLRPKNPMRALAG